MVKDMVAGIVTNTGEYLIVGRIDDGSSETDWGFISGLVAKKETP